jgi:hypothetical protein
MRRWILVASTLAGLVAALAVGPFGAAAAAPYVYGCTPANYDNGYAGYTVVLTIYNGSATTANLTHKILASNGTILNDNYPGLAVTSALPATTTVFFTFPTTGGPSAINDGTIPASVRIVSNVPVAPKLSFDLTNTGHDWKETDCTPLQP